MKVDRNAYHFRHRDAPLLSESRGDIDEVISVCVHARPGGRLPAAAQSGSSYPLASLSTQPSMNVFRRFAVEPAKMAGFYSEVLGLKQLPSLNMPGGGQMMLFEIGSAQVKLQFTAAAGEYKTGPCARSPAYASSRSSIPTKPPSRRDSFSTAIRRRRFVRAAATDAWRWCSIRRTSGSSSWSLPARPPDVYQSYRGRTDRVRSREESRVLS